MKTKRATPTVYVEPGTLVKIVKVTVASPRDVSRVSHRGLKARMMEGGRIGPEAGWDVYDIQLLDGRESWSYGLDLERIPESPRSRKQKSLLAGPKRWLFNWMGGGYNTVNASTRAEALQKAKTLGMGDGHRTTLVVNEGSLRQASQAEIDAEDRHWGPYD